MYSSSPKWLTIDTGKSSSNYVTVGNVQTTQGTHKLTPKGHNKPEQNLFKSNFMSRYSSQEDLQAHFKNKFLADDLDNSPKSQQDSGFKKNNFFPRKSKHDQRTSQKGKFEKEKVSNFRPNQIKRKSNIIDSMQFKNTNASVKNSIIQTRAPKHLKETSSTSSTDHLGFSNAPRSEKSIPSFLKHSTLNKKKNQESYQPFSLPMMGDITIQHFKILQRLGQGKFGSVFLAKQKATGFMVALKMIEKKRVIEENFLTQFIRQMKIQAFLDHPNIAKVYGFFHDTTHFYLIMELGQGGQLYDIVKNGETLSQESTSFIIGNLLDAVNYLHKKKILHRDIKPQNIVLVHGNVKLCDFGWAVYKKGQLRSTFCGTPLYLSPQLLNGEKYDQKVDLWAIGILAFELHLGSSPFNIQSQQDLLKIVTSQIQYPQHLHISKNFKDFMAAVLKKDPKQRLTADKLIELKFISRYRQLQTCQQLCQ